MRKTLTRVGTRAILALALLVAMFGVAVFTASSAHATPSSHCWVYMGGSTSSGGCLGSPYGGTDFQVVEMCRMWGVSETSPWTYAPANWAVSATTGSCPWWAGGTTEAWVNSY